VAGQLLWGGLAVRHGCLIPWLRGKVEAMALWPAVRRRWSSSEHESVLGILAQQEREIIDLQRETGIDRFWMWYRQVAGDAE
jgi:hypothetical protein